VNVVPIKRHNRPVVPYVPPAVSPKSINLNQSVIRFPNQVNRKQKYFQIEILPASYLDGTEKFVIPIDNLSILGFLTSSLFAVWVKGINSHEDFTINDKTMYNSFPFPDINKSQSEAIEKAVNYVFEARAETQFKNLKDIYTPDSMPEYLVKAHENLDRVLFPIFGLPIDANNEQVLETLFKKYLELLNGKA
jgi:hypothetical protein